MKITIPKHFLTVLSLAFVAGCAAPQPAVPPPALAFHPGQSIARSIKGESTYESDGHSSKLRVNQALAVGTIIKTSPGSEAYLQVNGLISTVRISEETIVELTKMNARGSNGAGLPIDTETVITLDQGRLLGSVGKLSANSSYEIHTPKGVAVVRGTGFSVEVHAAPEPSNAHSAVRQTDFYVEVNLLPVGTYRITYICMTGRIVVTADIAGATVTKTLSTGESWVPGEGDVKPIRRFW